MTKKTYRISCEWSVFGTMLIEANSLKQAKQIAEDDAPLPTDPDYIDGSFRICENITEYFYEEDFGKK